MNRKNRGHKRNTNKRKQKLNRNKRKNQKQLIQSKPPVVIPPPTPQPHQSSKTEAFLSGVLGSTVVSACFQEEVLLSIGEFFVVDAIPFVTEHWESISTWVSNTFV